MNFTENQQKIIHQVDGPVLVIACPGSGKTTTIIGRIHYMVKEKQILPSQILVATFTKAAAEEMQKRYENGENAIPGVTFCTIHSLCYNVLARRYNLSFKNIIKASEQYKFFQQELEGNVNPKDIEDTTKLILSKISYVRNADIPYQIAEIPEFSKNDFIRYFEDYAAFKRNINKIDFDDMIEQTRALFKAEPATLTFWQDAFPYICIDEYQDTNKVQAEIFNMLASKYQNICVVGDDDQSIYGFRSADSSIMLGFEQTYENCKRFDLDTNYRSVSSVIDAASTLIAKNKIRFSKDFKGHRTEKGTTEFIHKESPMQQTEEIIEKIKSLHKDGVEYTDIAVLYRNNKHAIPFIGAFALNEIPYEVKDTPKNIFKDIIFKDIHSYYNLAFDKEEQGDFQRVLNHPSRYLKRDFFTNCTFKNKKELINICYKTQRPEMTRRNLQNMITDVKILKKENPVLFFEALHSIGYLEWLKNDYAGFCKRSPESLEEMYLQLQEEAVKYETMEEFIKYGVEMAEKLEEQVKTGSGVILSTFHSAKGLEWKYVFVVNVDEGICPSKYALTEAELEEERRVFYVAITRAKDSLFVYSNSPIPSIYFQEMGEKRKIEKTSNSLNEFKDFMNVLPLSKCHSVENKRKYKVLKSSSKTAVLQRLENLIDDSSEICC